MFNRVHEAVWFVIKDARITSVNGFSLDINSPIVIDASNAVFKLSGSDLSEKAKGFISWYLRNLRVVTKNENLYIITQKGMNLRLQIANNEQSVKQQVLNDLRNISRAACRDSKARKMKKALVQSQFKNVVKTENTDPSTNEIIIIVSGKTATIPDTSKNRDILRKMISPF
jgi:hypothetical protein